MKTRLIAWWRIHEDETCCVVGGAYLLLFYLMGLPRLTGVAFLVGIAIADLLALAFGAVVLFSVLRRWYRDHNAWVIHSLRKRLASIAGVRV